MFPGAAGPLATPPSAGARTAPGEACPSCGLPHGDGAVVRLGPRHYAEALRIASAWTAGETVRIQVCPGTAGALARLTACAYEAIAERNAGVSGEEEIRRVARATMASMREEYLLEAYAEEAREVTAGG